MQKRSHAIGFQDLGTAWIVAQSEKMLQGNSTNPSLYCCLKLVQVCWSFYVRQFQKLNDWGTMHLNHCDTYKLHKAIYLNICLIIKFYSHKFLPYFLDWRFKMSFNFISCLDKHLMYMHSVSEPLKTHVVNLIMAKWQGHFQIFSQYQSFKKSPSASTKCLTYHRRSIQRKALTTQHFEICWCRTYYF